MSAAGVITEFLASVGFRADEKSLKSSLLKVTAFGMAVQAAAVGIYAGITRVASGEAELARQAEALHTTTDRIRELGYVAEQSGAGMDAVTRSLEGLVSKNPRIKDAAKALELAGEKMRNMNDAQRKAYAARMGIDPSLIPALTSDVTKLKDEFRAMYAVANIDAKEAAESSKAFMAEIGKLGTIAGLLGRAVALSFIGRVRHDIEHLRLVIMENFDKIKRVLEAVIAVILRIAAVISATVYRVIKFVAALVSWFDKLSDGQKKVIIGIGLLLAAWKLLNAGFLATPLGMIIAGLLGILALVDDYLTYMEGGESYFDWGPWADTIETAKTALSKVIAAIGAFVTEHQPLLQSLAKGMALFMGLKKAVGIVGLLSGAFKALNVVMKANPVGLLLSLLCMAAMLVIDNWETVQAFFLGLWESVEKKAAAAADFFIGVWQGVKDWFLSLWDDAMDSFPDLGAWAEGAARSMKECFGTGVQWIKDKIKSIVGMLPDWVLEKMGLKPGNEEPAAPATANPPEQTDAQKAAAAAQSTQGPALTPSPAQAAAIDKSTHTQTVTVHSNTEINVTASDPVAAGNQVAANQDRVNADLTRHARGAAK